LIRVILADTQAIFRAGLRKIFALEDDIRVVGQAETLSADAIRSDKVLGGRSSFSKRRWRRILWRAVTELLRQAPQLKVVVVTAVVRTSSLLSIFSAAARTAFCAREVEPEILIDCLRKVAAGEPWLAEPSRSLGHGRISAGIACALLERAPRSSSRPRKR
jgi:DNA-binding NarL/FixJ family response regulator